YHQRCGALLALVYALGGTDFHHENLLACGEHPVLIDLETLLAHRFDLVERVPNQAFGARVVRERMQLSVLATQMLPHLKLAADGQGASSGALRRAVPAREGEVPAWLDCNADTMRPGRRRVQLPPEDASLPTADGRPVPAAEHVDALVEGFTTTYRLLMGGREALLAPGGAVDRMRGQPVRFILRHTSLYTALLERCLHPSFLGDGVARGIELDVLCRPFVALGEKPAAWPALRAEMRELEQLDVPIFTPASDSTSLPVGDGEEAPGCFERDAFGETVRRLKSLDEADLALQVRLVHAAFLADESPGLCSIVSPSSSQAAAAGDDAEIESVALREAREIARTLAASAVWGDDGEAGWFSASYAPRARRFDAGAGAANLLDGYVGTAFFLAALHRVSPEDGVRDLAVAALRPLSAHLDTYAGMFRQRRDRDLGAGTGFGSLLYALPHLAAWLGQPALLGAARELSTLLDGLPAPEPMRCDLVSGAAGVIPGLLLLHRLGDADALERARAAGRGLLEARVREPRDGLALWAGNRGLAEAGLAHGQSGIASALFRLATASGDDEFAAAAREALVFERRMVAESGGNTPEAHAAWSTGDTGIGLALAAAGPHAGAEEIAALERAVERSLAHRLHGGDAACGGFPGRVELMLSAGQALGRPEWAAEARRTAVDAAARATARGGWRTGWEPFAHPGLFVGLSGIGYQLLRAAPPHVLPPVLSWG
ncbi:MAG TPA: type 2 lanthipeptide synthetase LanM, partial [Longimicrobium sp.]|nr:type 2 lanthipeptide synthetase LanM [Longimicrobium sp.]